MIFRYLEKYTLPSKIFIVCLLVAVVIVAAIAGRVLYINSVSNNWLETNGIVRKVFVSYPLRKSQGYVDIDYSYQIGEKTFNQRSMLSEGIIPYGFDKVYSVGSSIAVYYNPSNHSESVLIKGTKIYNIAVVLSFLFLFLMFYISFLMKPDSK